MEKSPATRMDKLEQIPHIKSYNIYTFFIIIIRYLILEENAIRYCSWRDDNTIIFCRSVLLINSVDERGSAHLMYVQEADEARKRK